ncbi:hypothetical protein Taro_002095 [Colocasia esculenta]|uniref:Uncharacterized protein n=1 Tax=Colocasia esculenta TaxID=4460 RepID=A0A843TD49_COLES|nr:hypothetical protein [Colocasia esculenta]
MSTFEMLKGMMCFCSLITFFASHRIHNTPSPIEFPHHHECSRERGGSDHFLTSIVLEANSEVFALLGRIPAVVWYQPTLATDLEGLQEQITTIRSVPSPIRSIYYVPTDD